MRFTKMHGIGNDFVMVNAFTESLPSDLESLSKDVCDRRFGVGSDGFILAQKGQELPFEMRMFNPDGSESEMCGNGVRCFAKFLRDEGLTQDALIPVETGAGRVELAFQIDGQVQVNMGKARLTRGEIGMSGPAAESFINQPIQGYMGTAVSMGNPHVVIFVDDVSSIDLEEIGPQIEVDPLFPRRVNVHFVQVIDREHLIQRTWERGAGITLACGTGACACAVASYLNGHSERQVDIKLPGGHLRIDYRENDEVFMTGPAETVFVGQWS